MSDFAKKNTLVFKYWGGVKSRNIYVCGLLAAYGLLDTVDLKTDYPWPGTDDWRNLSRDDLSHCKQLPCLEDNDVTLQIGESFAIIRYLCRKFDLNPQDLVTFGLSEQQIQWADSVHVILSQAQYATSRKQAMDKLFQENGKISIMMKGLNEMLSTRSNALVPGDYVAICAVYILESLQSGIVDSHAHVKDMYTRVMKIESVKSYLDTLGYNYFTRENESLGLKLVYFNGRGLAETSRMLLAAAAVDYEDFRYPLHVNNWETFDVVRDEFDLDKKEGKLKESLGKLPVLHVTSNEKTTSICQSKSIERYLARYYGFMGSSELEGALIDRICEFVRDFKSDYQTVRKDPDKDQAMETWFGTVLPGKLQQLDDILIGDLDHCVGTTLSLADLTVYSFLVDFFDNKDGVLSAYKNCPRLSRVVETVRNNHNIIKWIESRPDTPF